LSALVNIDGEVFGMWRVMGRAPVMGKRLAANWWCLCACGTFKHVPSSALRNGQSFSCGCTRDYKHSVIKPTDPHVYSARWVIYRDTAKRRGFAFDLTLSQFVEIVTKDCHYCGSAGALPVRKERKYGQNLLMNGIDRLENTIGYRAGNVVPCCTICNTMKHVANSDDFLSRVRRIAERHATST
jgi:hypothetical protein